VYVADKIRLADEYIIPPYIPVRTKELQHPKGMLSWNFTNYWTCLRQISEKSGRGFSDLPGCCTISDRKELRDLVSWPGWSATISSRLSYMCAGSERWEIEEGNIVSMVFYITYTTSWYLQLCCVRWWAHEMLQSLSQVVRLTDVLRGNNCSTYDQEFIIYCPLQ